MRRWLMLLILLMALPARATTYYVSSDGTGDGSANNVPMSPARLLDYMMTAGTPDDYDAAAGDVFYLKAGAGDGYTLTASWTWTADGTAADPISIVGCDSSWNVVVPTRTNWGALNTDSTGGTVCPYLNFNGNYTLAATGSDYVIFSGLCIASACTGGGSIQLGANSVAYGCAVSNAGSNANANAIYLYNPNSVCLFCDAACSQSTSGAAIYSGSNNYGRVVGCRISDSGSYGIQCGGTAIVVDNVIFNCTNYGVALTSSTTSHWLIAINNTVYGKGISLGDYAYTIQSILVGNHLTDGAGYGILGPQAAGTPAVLAFNRTRDNTSGAISWAGTWDSATTWQHITSDDAPATDFVASGSNDFRLLNTAAAIDKGVFGAIGAINLPAATLPAVSDVWTGVTNWGYSWAWSTGTKRASSIMYCEAGNIKSGVTIDNVTGTYAGSGGGAGGGAGIGVGIGR